MSASKNYRAASSAAQKFCRAPLTWEVPILYTHLAVLSYRGSKCSFIFMCLYCPQMIIIPRIAAQCFPSEQKATWTLAGRSRGKFYPAGPWHTRSMLGTSVSICGQSFWGGVQHLWHHRLFTFIRRRRKKWVSCLLAVVFPVFWSAAFCWDTGVVRRQSASVTAGSLMLVLYDSPKEVILSMVKHQTYT